MTHVGQLDPIVARLYHRRLALGLSQREVAQRMGVRQGMISAWETGRFTPMLPTLRRWAEVLDLSLTAVTAESQSNEVRDALLMAAAELQTLVPPVGGTFADSRVRQAWQDAVNRVLDLAIEPDIRQGGRAEHPRPRLRTQAPERVELAPNQAATVRYLLDELPEIEAYTRRRRTLPRELQ